MAMIAVRLADSQEKDLAVEERRLKMSTSEIVRLAVSEFLQRSEERRVLAAMAAEIRARTKEEWDEHMEMADWSVASANEVLRVADKAPRLRGYAKKRKPK